jgi:hypothetical protein
VAAISDVRGFRMADPAGATYAALTFAWNQLPLSAYKQSLAPAQLEQFRG